MVKRSDLQAWIHDELYSAPLLSAPDESSARSTRSTQFLSTVQSGTDRSPRANQPATGQERVARNRGVTHSAVVSEKPTLCSHKLFRDCQQPVSYDSPESSERASAVKDCNQQRILL